MKGVQCYELFGGIALKNHTFSFSFSINTKSRQLFETKYNTCLDKKMLIITKNGNVRTKKMSYHK